MKSNYLRYRHRIHQVLLPVLIIAGILGIIFTSGCIQEPATDPDMNPTTGEVTATTTLKGLTTTMSSVIYATPITTIPVLSTATTIPSHKGITVNIPFEDTITIDGDSGDWESIPVFIYDESEDVMPEDFYGNILHEFDVTAIRATYSNTHLYLLVEFNRDLQQYFTANKNQSKVIGTLFLDTDNDNTTGGSEFFSKRGGFESQVEFRSGVCTKDGSTCVSGDAFIDSYTGEEYEYFIKILPSQYHEGPEGDVGDSSLTTDFGVSLDSGNNPDAVAYKGNIIEIGLPVASIGIDTENYHTIRVLFAEGNTVFARMWDGTFSEEVTGEFEMCV